MSVLYIKEQTFSGGNMQSKWNVKDKNKNDILIGPRASVFCYFLNKLHIPWAAMSN